ncbi:hypothetical protein QFZ89_008405 [Paraburkholderia youngii]
MHDAMQAQQIVPQAFRIVKACAQFVERIYRIEHPRRVIARLQSLQCGGINFTVRVVVTAALALIQRYLISS